MKTTTQTLIVAYVIMLFFFSCSCLDTLNNLQSITIDDIKDIEEADYNHD